MDNHGAFLAAGGVEPGPIISGLVIGSLILTVFVRAGAAWGAKAQLSFGKAFGVAFIAALVVSGIRYVAATQQDIGPVVQYLGVPVMFFVFWGLLVAMGGIEAKKAARASMITTGMMLVLSIAVLLIVAGSIG